VPASFYHSVVFIIVGNIIVMLTQVCRISPLSTTETSG